MRTAACVLLTVTVLATACGGGGDPNADEVSLANASSSTTESPETTSTTTTTEPPTTTSTTTTTTTTTTAPPATPTTAAGLSDEDQILAIIDLYWHALVEGMNPPDPEAAIWEQVAIGSQLDHLRDRAAEKLAAAEGNRYREDRYALVTRAEFISLEDGIAGVNTCIFDDTLLYDLETGEILDDELRLGWVQIVLEESPAGWRVFRTEIIERHETEEECDAAF